MGFLVLLVQVLEFVGAIIVGIGGLIVGAFLLTGLCIGMFRVWERIMK